MPAASSQINRKENSVPYYYHELPGRLRIKIPSLRRNPRNAERLQSFLEDIRGVVSTSTNPITGSIVIRFAPDIITTRAILDLLNRERYLDSPHMMIRQEYFSDAVSKAGHAASKALVGLALDRALQGSSLSFIAALI